MRLVMTLKVRDEEDVIEDNLRFHGAMGVDFFIVMDNGSVDQDAGDPGALRGRGARARAAGTRAAT